jgi:hypothetical protein
MVDATDLKSVVRLGRASSSLATPITKSCKKNLRGYQQLLVPSPVSSVQKNLLHSRPTSSSPNPNE